MRVKLTDPNHPHFAPNPAESVKGNAVVDFAGKPPEHIMAALAAGKLEMTDDDAKPNTLPGQVPQEGTSAVVRKAAWDTPEREAQARAESEGTPAVFPEPLAPTDVGKPVEARPRPAIVETDPSIWAGVDPATVPSGPENYTIKQPEPTEPDDQGGQVKTDEEAIADAKEAAADKVEEEAAEAGANIETEEEADEEDEPKSAKSAKAKK